MNRLLIVESPTKANTIGKMLGKDYTIIASMGHIRNLPEHDLGVCIVLRLQNIDGLVLVDGSESTFGQFFGNTGAQHGGTIQAQYGVHRRIVDEVCHQLPGTVFCLTQARLLISNIYIVIDMTVIGGKVATGIAQRRIPPANRQIDDFDHRKYLRFILKKEKRPNIRHKRFRRML